MIFVQVQELETAQSSASSRTVDATAALAEEKQRLEQQVKELQGELDSKQQVDKLHYPQQLSFPFI